MSHDYNRRVSNAYVRIVEKHVFNDCEGTSVLTLCTINKYAQARATILACVIILICTTSAVAQHYPPRSIFDGVPVGDSDGNGKVNIGDAVKLIAYIFGGDSLGYPEIRETFVDTCITPTEVYVSQVVIHTEWDTLIRPTIRTITTYKNGAIVDVMVETNTTSRSVYYWPDIPDYDSIFVPDSTQ